MDKQVNTIAILLLIILLISGAIFYSIMVIQQEAQWKRSEDVHMHYETILKLDRLEKELIELEKRIDEFIHKWNIEIFESSAYAPGDNQSGICADSNPEQTALGYVPGPGHFAVDFNIIPAHGQMWVQNEGWGIAADTGGLIKDRRVDVYRESYRAAMDYGRQRVIVAWPN